MSTSINSSTGVRRPVIPRPTGAQGRERPSPASSGRSAGLRSGLFVAIVVVGLLGLSAWGAEYYRADQPIRVRDPLHPWLRPSGYVGQTAGIVALFIFIFLWLYPLRKNVRWLRWTGAMARWLDVHVAVALIMPVLVAVHAAWRFDGLIGLGYWSMIVVCASGVIGRYLYVRIPRSASGLELTVEEIATERRELLAEVAAATELPEPQVAALLRADPVSYDGLGLIATVRQMVLEGWTRRRAVRALRRLCASRQVGHRLDRGAVREILRLASREMRLTQQVRMLNVTHRLFRLWHVAHRPFAITALVAVVVHVAVAISMGMTWFR